MARCASPGPPSDAGQVTRFSCRCARGLVRDAICRSPFSTKRRAFQTSRANVQIHGRHYVHGDEDTRVNLLAHQVHRQIVQLREACSGLVSGLSVDREIARRPENPQVLDRLLKQSLLLSPQNAALHQAGQRVLQGGLPDGQENAFLIVQQKQHDFFRECQHGTSAVQTHPGHAVSSNNSRPISIRRISEVPAPIS